MRNLHCMNTWNYKQVVLLNKMNIFLNKLHLYNLLLCTLYYLLYFVAMDCV